mmetsp:Transcript_147171/g.257064  ORF Transcript_147171/g.257064 Transcript_147171/m.257064 type:complete len:208 (+) Transcript_147171:527-1150(+)
MSALTAPQGPPPACPLSVNHLGAHLSATRTRVSHGRAVDSKTQNSESSVQKWACAGLARQMPELQQATRIRTEEHRNATCTRIAAVPFKPPSPMPPGIAWSSAFIGKWGSGASRTRQAIGLHTTHHTTHARLYYDCTTIVLRCRAGYTLRGTPTERGRGLADPNPPHHPSPVWSHSCPSRDGTQLLIVSTLPLGKTSLLSVAAFLTS